MQTYWVFVGLSVVAIATPGPGVLLTVSNALRFGFARSLPGILGLATGMLGVGAVSGAGLGAVLASSAMAFTVAKCVGAAYLVCLGANPSRDYVAQLAALALTFSALMVVVHCLYGAMASAAKQR